MAPTNPNNGDRYITWRAHEEHARASREEHAVARKAILDLIKSNSDRINALESLVDQLRGAKYILVAVFGTSVISLIIALVTLSQLLVHA